MVCDRILTVERLALKINHRYGECEISKEEVRPTVACAWWLQNVSAATRQMRPNATGLQCL